MVRSMSAIWKKRLEAGYSGGVPAFASGDTLFLPTTAGQNGLFSSPCEARSMVPPKRPWVPPAHAWHESTASTVPPFWKNLPIVAQLLSTPKTSLRDQTTSTKLLPFESCSVAQLLVHTPFDPS